MGWGSSYSDTVPGGASGYSGASGWGRNSSSFGGRTGGYNSGGRSGYLNSEYNSGAHGGFGDRYSKKQNTEYKRTVSTIAEMEALADDPDGYMSGKISGKDYEGYVRDRMAGRTTSGFGENYSQKSGTPLNDMKRVFFAGTPAPKSASTGPKHYEVGDIVEHKVFGRGRVLAVKAAAGDQIVEINFEKVGVKKTMANFAPLTKITEE